MKKQKKAEIRAEVDNAIKKELMKRLENVRTLLRYN